MIVVGLGALVTRWARVYADHEAVSGGVTYMHLAGILLGGGLAVAADRTVLRWSPEPGPDRSRELQRRGPSHRRVVGGPELTVLSGLGLPLADAGTYLTSAGL